VRCRLGLWTRTKPNSARCGWMARLMHCASLVSQVSTSAHALIALAHATMEEAAKSTTPKYARSVHCTCFPLLCSTNNGAVSITGVPRCCITQLATQWTCSEPSYPVASRIL